MARPPAAPSAVSRHASPAPPPAAPPDPLRWPAAAPADIARTLAQGEVHAWWLDLASPAWPWPQLAGWLDDEEHERAGRFHFERHRRRHVAAHGQMRAVLAAYAGTAPQALRFTREARGKPRLAGPAGTEAPGADAPGTDAAGGVAGAGTALAFNLSHSEDQALLAVVRGAPIGADIEVARPMSDLAAVARSHFGAAELRAWLALPEPLRLDGFFAAWTRKEAYVKALGAGLAVPLSSFEVTLHPEQTAALCAIEGSPEAAAGWTLWADRPAPGTWAALAVRLRGALVRTFTVRRPDGEPPR